KRVLSLHVEDELKQTVVEIDRSGTGAEQIPEPLPVTEFDAIKFPSNAPPLPFTGQNVESKILSKRLQERDLQTLLQTNGWEADDLAEFAAHWRARQDSSPGIKVFAFRERAGFFGNNAPPYQSLRNRNDQPLFSDDWDSDGWPIWEAYPNEPSTPAI